MNVKSNNVGQDEITNDMQETQQGSTSTTLLALPGQVRSTSQELAQSQTSSTEFDLEIFRQGTSRLDQNCSKIANEIENDNSQNIHGLQTVTIWGIKFVLAYLQERNKNPALLIQCIYIPLIFFAIAIIFTFYIGLNYRIYLLPICIVQICLDMYIVTTLCNSPAKKSLKLNKKQKIVVLGIMNCQTFLIIFAYGFEVPFDSMPLFLLMLFILHFLSLFSFSLAVYPNSRNWHDPNYQLRFFVSRIMISFFNSSGMVDVYSDIALGLDLVRNFQGYIFYIGIAIFIVCIIDYSFLVFRILQPTKIPVARHIATIVVEVMVIALSVSVLFGVSNDATNSEEIKQESIIIVAISVTTTLVNFLHHIFLLYDHYIASSSLHSNLSIING